MSDDATPAREEEQVAGDRPAEKSADQPEGKSADQPEGKSAGQPVAREKADKPRNGSSLGNGIWLSLVAIALVIGCCLGAGAITVGAFVADHIFDDRRHHRYVDHGPGDRFRDPQHKRQVPIPQKPDRLPLKPSPSPPPSR